MKKRIDLNTLLLDIDGKPMKLNNEEKTLAELFAQQLSQLPRSSDPVKAWSYALELHAGKVIECDDSDVRFLRDAVLQTGLLVIAQAQVLERIDNAEEVK